MLLAGSLIPLRARPIETSKIDFKEALLVKRLLFKRENIFW